MITRKEFKETIKARVEDQRQKLEKLIDTRIDTRYAKDGDHVIIDVKKFRPDIVNEVAAAYRKGGWFMTYDQDKRILTIR